RSPRSSARCSGGSDAQAPQGRRGAAAHGPRPARRALLDRERRLRPERVRDAARRGADAGPGGRGRRHTGAALPGAGRGRLLPAFQARAASQASRGGRAGRGARPHAPRGLPRPSAARAPARARAALPVAAAGVARQLEEAGQESESWGTGLGAGGRTSPGRKIELGRRLATNPKLRKLAAAVGRMREQALALRRSPFERASEEVFEVRLGSDLERLLPPELLALHHPLLRRDFARRLVEGRLLSYSLRGADQRGRGPM